MCNSKFKITTPVQRENEPETRANELKEQTTRYYIMSCGIHTNGQRLKHSLDENVILKGIDLCRYFILSSRARHNQIFNNSVKVLILLEPILFLGLINGRKNGTSVFFFLSSRTHKFLKQTFT